MTLKTCTPSLVSAFGESPTEPPDPGGERGSLRRRGRGELAPPGGEQGPAGGAQQVPHRHLAAVRRRTVLPGEDGQGDLTSLPASTRCESQRLGGSPAAQNPAGGPSCAPIADSLSQGEEQRDLAPPLPFLLAGRVRPQLPLMSGSGSGWGGKGLNRG